MIFTLTLSLASVCIGCMVGVLVICLVSVIRDLKTKGGRR
mgnify:CR=1 FL=1